MAAAINLTFRITNETSLHFAAKDNSIPKIKHLLSQGADVNKRYQLGRTPLHMAAHENKKNSHFESIDFLLKNGANVNGQDSYKNTPLQLLIDKAEIEIVKLLLKFGADVNIRNDNNEIPLFGAIASGKIEIVKLLLDHGSMVELKNTENALTPLATATLYSGDSDFEICKLLLKNGADVNAKLESGNTPFHYLVRRANAETVKLFLDFEADVNIKNDDGEIPLFNAIRYNDKDVIQLLLNYGSDVNSVNKRDGSTLLHVACKYGSSIETIKSLLEKGLDFNALDNYGHTPMLLGMFNSNSVSLAFLLKYTDFSFVDISGDNTFCFYSYENTWKVNTEHFAKLQALDIALHPSILDDISNNEEQKSYFENCTKELTEAKNTKLKECWVTFFNLLVDSKRKLKNYAGNQDLMKQFENSDCKNKFPIYGASMEKNVIKGMRMRKFFDYSVEVLSDCLPSFNPTHLIIRDILDCLSSNELSKLC